MATVFISFNSADKPFVEALAKVLGEAGHQVLYDHAVLVPGTSLRSALDVSLRSSDAVILIVSNNSHNSQWVMTEFGFARGLGIPVLPVVLDGIGIPPALREFTVVLEPGRDVSRVAMALQSGLASLAARKAAEAKAKADVQARIGKNAEEFINESVRELKERETVYRRFAYAWYGAGLLMLLAAIGAGIWRAIQLPSIHDWSTIVLFGLVVLLVVVLLLAGSKYAFTLGKSFMVEALRNSDRRHAINFGRFYLKAYSEHAEWSEVKEAFQHWNMDKGSSFLAQDAASYDPKLLEQVVEMSKAVVGLKKDEEKK